MDRSIELTGADARATFVDGRWLLVTDRGHLVELATAVANQPDGGRVRWVVSDPTDADTAAAAAAHLAAQRDVLQLRRPLPVEPAVTSSYPTIDVRPFRPGTADEQAWITCNNRSFAGHPDQGQFTLDRLHHVMLEPWFDPAGFLLYEQDARLAGFCWTKVHADADPPLGEIFVIGVDPEVGGRGLGGALTLAGLSWLAAHGLDIGMLYVDGDNTKARHMYARLGFEVHHTDRIFE